MGTLEQVLGQWDDGTESNRIRLVRDVARVLRVVFTAGGVEQCNISLGVVLDLTSIMLCLSYGSGAVRATLNNGIATVLGTASVGTMPTGLTTWRSGKDVTGNFHNGYVAQEVHWPYAVSDGERAAHVATWRSSRTTLDVLAYSYLARASVTPSSTWGSLIDTLVKGLRSNDLLSDVDALHLWDAPDSWATRQNLVSSRFQCVQPSAGQRVVTFEPGGIRGDNNLAYLTSGFNPAADVLWQQDSAHMLVAEGSNRAGADKALLGQTNARIQTLTAAGNVSFRLNQTGNSNFANPGGTSKGLYFGSRTDAANVRGYKNGTLLGTSAVASTTVSANPLGICGNVASTSDALVWMTGWGRGLSPAKVAAYNGLLEAYANGRGASLT